MPLMHYIWLLLYYANLARSNLIEEFQSVINSDRGQLSIQFLPIALPEDGSGCDCRSTAQRDLIVCFGFFACTSFPKSEISSKKLKVKSTNIVMISKGDTDNLHLNCLEINSNRNLQRLEPYAFWKLSTLEHFSLSFNEKLRILDENVFVGLTGLKNLTLVNNGFNSLQDATRALRPNVLPAIKRFDISENYFVSIMEDDFSAMTGSTIIELKILLCQTEYIHPRSLLPLTMLKDLHIGENNINSTVIGNVILELEQNNINLNSLNIMRMGFRKSPPRKLLDIIANTTISKLILAQNQFELLTNTTFPGMTKIEFMDLRQILAVYIEKAAFEPSKFPNLKVLLLSGNNLLGLQALLSPRLRHLDLSYNTGSMNNAAYFNIAPDSFAKSSHLEILNLSFNRIITLYNFTFQGLDHLKILSLKNGTIFRIKSYAFKPLSHLEMLSLEDNPFLQNNDDLNRDEFSGLNMLRVLIFSNCGISTLDDNFFTVFPNLTHLILKNNKIISMTPESLKPLVKLKILDLSNNLIVSWRSPLFKPSHAPIHYLGLNNNKITRFTVSMLEDIEYVKNNHFNQSEVHLLGNVFVCDCSSMYIAFSWMALNGSDRLNNFFGNSQFTCTTPASWEHKRVASYLSTYHGLNCSIYHSKIIVVLYTLATIILVLLLVSAVVTLYVYRFYVSFWIFLAKLSIGRSHITKTSNELSKKTEFTYDAFVSYSSEDREIVIEIISELENHSPFYKLCVYERDFMIGAYISEAILSSINESKFIILIVSDHFAKSQWCRWETQLAEYHRLFLDGSYNYDPLILIRIGDVKAKNMTLTLKYLLRTKIYLKWENGDHTKNREFWDKLRSVLKKS